MANPISVGQDVRKGVTFVLPGPVMPPQTPPICKTTESFISACEKLYEAVKANPTDITVNVALLALQEKFFSCYALAPASCRKHMYSDKVICLMATYEDTYRKLHEIRLHVTPPRLREEPAPPAQITQVIQYPGFPIGEVIEEDEETDD
jgi:hypothetical protein